MKKVWIDGENANNTRPESLIVKLLADGAEAGQVTLNAANKWADSIADLPKYTEAGTEIVYTWSEEALTAGYKLTGESTEGLITTLTNTLVIEVSVKKVWIDGENAENTRPESLIVKLLADGTEIDQVTLKVANNWLDSIAELPK